MRNPFPELQDAIQRAAKNEKLRKGLREAGNLGERGVKTGCNLIKHYKLRLLLLACPLLSSDQGPVRDEIGIVDETNSPAGVFDNYQQEAKKDIKKALEEKKGKLSEESTILQEALDYPEDELMALAIKESRLDPKARNGGYLQLTQSAISDLERVFKHRDFSLNAGPEQNIEQGAMYLALIQEKYISKHPLAKDMSEADQRALAHFFYNMGPTAGVRLWEETGAKTLEEFEAGIVEILGNRMSNWNAIGIDIVGPSSTDTVEDPNYHVEYKQSGAEAIYLEKTEGKKTGYEAILKEPFFKGSHYPTVEKVIISLRYLHLTDAIADELKDPNSRETYLAEMFGETEQTQEKPSFTSRTVRKGESLWTLSQESGVSVDYLKGLNKLSSDSLEEGSVLKVPSPSLLARNYLYNTKIGSQKRTWIQVSPGKGFYSTLVENDGYKKYLSQSAPIEQEDIEEVVFMFNKTFNPEFATVESTRDIPLGTLIWIPNVQYFIDYFKDTVGKKDTPEADPDDESEEASAGFGTIPSGPLNSKVAGQYVKKSGSHWVLDTAETREGAQAFPKKSWGDHPTWTVAGDLKRRRFGGNDGLKEVRWIVLHATISSDSHSTVNRELAHFAVERDGTIEYIVSVNKADKASDKIPPHAGKSCWDGVQDLNRYAVGIEVVANGGQNWSAAQYDSVGDLVHWLGGYYGLEERDVLTHKQIAADPRYGRGRKSDPYADSAATFWANLDLPNNSNELDLCVARGTTKANTSAIKSDGNHTGVWMGLQAAETNF